MIMGQTMRSGNASDPLDPGFDPLSRLADYAKREGWGRKTMLVSFTLIQSLLTLAFGFYIMNGGQSVFVLGALLFTASLFFNALQPMSHTLTADLEPSAAYLGAALLRRSSA